MREKLRDWLHRLRPRSYNRRPALVLLNGLAEQAETWYRNLPFWRRHFDVHVPNFLLFEGGELHRRIEEGQPITVDYLVEQLHHYLENFVQTPPYHIVASSLGGKIAVEYAARYPEQVGRLVLLCPSGMGDHEQLPLVEGVRRSDLQALVDSVFHNRRHADADVVAYYRKQFSNRRWRTGLLRTIRGTMAHSVRARLPQVGQPTLLVAGREDRIVDALEAARAVRELPQGHFLLLRNCGHAPHIEKSWLINRLVVHFLTHPRPSPHPRLDQLILTTPSMLL